MADSVKLEKRTDKTAKTKRNFLQKVAGFFITTVKKLKQFFINLKAELKRVVWPDRKKLIHSTATVLAICLIIGLVLFMIDSLLGGVLNAIGFYTPNTTITTTTTTATTASTAETTAETSAETGPTESEPAATTSAAG
jgi:preprotein translocase subunit SecE